MPTFVLSLCCDFLFVFTSMLHYIKLQKRTVRRIWFGSSLISKGKVKAPVEAVCRFLNLASKCTCYCTETSNQANYKLCIKATSILVDSMTVPLWARTVHNNIINSGAVISIGRNANGQGR
jgi:hypothetical protein